jgi:hypothetical protein
LHGLARELSYVEFARKREKLAPEMKKPLTLNRINGFESGCGDRI